MIIELLSLEVLSVWMKVQMEFRLILAQLVITIKVNYESPRLLYAQLIHT